MKKAAARLFSLLLVLLLAITVFPTTAFADEGSADYYLSFKKFSAAENPDGSRTISYNEITDQISNLLDEGLRRYEAGVEKDGDDGYYKPFTNSYGFWYETSGFEKTVMGYISGARVNEVELQFSNMKKAVNNGESLEVVSGEVDKLIALLREDADYLDELFGYTTTDSSGSGLAIATFAAVFSIIVREGLEAILIVGAMAAYLVKTGNKRGTIYVYIGTVLAVIASFLAAVIFYGISAATSSSLSQEFLEGVTALVAVCVLFYVSNWMVSKSESAAWTGYITGKVSESAGTGRFFALGGTAFLAVFREGAEVILFCQQYFSRASSMNNGYLALAAGIVLGLVCVLVVFVLIRVFGVKLPLGIFFKATSGLMAVMCIAFLGAGMWELFVDGGVAGQIGGWVQNLAGTIPALSWMSGSDILAFFGLYPTWLTLGPQIILTVITIITLMMSVRKAKAKAAAETPAA